ncbi:MAG: hypothetical protein JST75_04155 [Bacteroidetes bacterium]|nr:hypothetical protein [Bacteroidota bacterium]
MNRRHFIHTSGLSLAAVLTSDLIFGFPGSPKQSSINFPDKVSAIVADRVINLSSSGKQKWTGREIIVEFKDKGDTMAVTIQSPKVKLSQVNLYWNIPGKRGTILNDQWERTYGDISWHALRDTEMLPWYFMERHGENTNGFGVKTGTRSFCFWQIANDQLTLSLDTRSGSDGVQLGERKLEAAEIITIQSKPGESVFETTKRFTRMMCDKVRMPAQPVYGINDWYFSYGNNSAKLIEEHTQLMVPMSEGLANRPFSVIDAGWFKGPPSAPNDSSWGDNMSDPNDKFVDMAALAKRIKEIGMRPGLWTRPLCGSYKDPQTLLLPDIAGREKNKPVLDPSVPENIERIRKYFKLYDEWGYEMVKFDYTTFDIMGKWGFEMMRDRKMTSGAWSMNDSSKTNAEIILNMYQQIREAAGEMYVIGCNTISHLSAGLFELNRIGDDTSGNEWERTRKMGVNALAFRGVHQGNFYAADADCVGLTTKIPWEKNKQWMELVAASGTPLFISAQPSATGAAQKETIRKCFNLASLPLPVGEPLDWMETATPKKWKLNGEVKVFDWS